MPTEPQKSDGCTIILHPNNDGTHHWFCPNCKREDLGLSAETDLANYLPNVTCSNCGSQYGVDKRYLIDQTKPELLDEAGVTQIEATVNGNAPLRAYLSQFGVDIPALCQSLRAVWARTNEALTEQRRELGAYYDELSGKFSRVQAAAKDEIERLESENTALREQLAEAHSVSAESAAREIAERFIGSGDNIETRRERCAEAILTAIIRAAKG